MVELNGKKIELNRFKYWFKLVERVDFMEERYLSIKEFAECAKVSVQSVYKRINKDDDIIHKFIKIKDGKKIISYAAIEKIYNNDSGQYEEFKEEKAAPEDDIILILKKQVEQQQKEIDIKNEQIEKLNKQLEESGKREERYQELLQNQQTLSAMDRQKILQLESAADKKRNIFNIFKRKTKG